MFDSGKTTEGQGRGVVFLKRQLASLESIFWYVHAIPVPPQHHDSQKLPAQLPSSVEDPNFFSFYEIAKPSENLMQVL